MKTLTIFIITVTFLSIAIFFLISKTNTLVNTATINSQDFVLGSSDIDFPHFYEPVPGKKTINPPTSGAGQTVQTINSDGLNERFEYSVTKSEDVFRILTLGDSFTEGLWVDTPNNYPERLEELLNKNSKCLTQTTYEVINLGVMGYDVAYSAKRYLTRGQKYEPDLILWLVKEDDFRVPNTFIANEYYTYPEAERSLNPHLYWSKAQDKILANSNSEDILNFEYTHMEKVLQSNTHKSVFVIAYENMNPEVKTFLKRLTKHPNVTFSPFLKETTNFGDTDLHPDEPGYESLAIQIRNKMLEYGMLPKDNCKI